MSRKLSNILLIALCLGTLTLWLCLQGAIRFTNPDDMHMVFYSQSWSSLWQHTAYYVKLTGRLSHVLFTLQASVPYLNGSEAFYVLAKDCGLILMFGSYAFFIATLGQSWRFAGLATILMLGFAEINWNFNPIVSYPFVISMQLACLFASFSMFLLSLRDPSSRWKLVTSAFLFFFCCASYEGYVPFLVCFPLMVWLEKTKGESASLPLREIWRATWIHLMASAIWLLAYGTFRWGWGGQEYNGVNPNLSDPLRIVKTYVSYLISAFPGASVFGRNDSTSEALSQIANLRNPDLRPGGFLAFIFLFALSTLLLAPLSSAVKLRKVLVFGCVQACLSFPLLAISTKYQQLDSISYIYYVPTLLASLAWSAVLAGCLILVHRAKNFRWRGVYALALVIVLAAAIIVQGFNLNTLAEMRESTRRWQLVDRFFERVNPPVLAETKALVLPTLGIQYGAARANREYWEEYIEKTRNHRTHVLFDEKELTSGVFPALVVQESNPELKFKIVVSF